MSRHIPIATCSQILEASMIQMELDSAGIDCELDNEFTVGVDPLLANAVGGIKITVAAEDAQRAAQMLEKYYEERARAEAEKARVCPKCKHKNGSPVAKPNWAGIVSVLTLGAFSLFYAWPRYHCPRCKHRWS
ncbi:DUF2007 domain-containing protein [Pontiella sp.]|uniref:putative signal transducing protein n=1 Tax=Pontiella sp. TaxID=2837462 RepID=UPI003567C09C